MLQPTLKSINQLFEYALTQEPLGPENISQITGFDSVTGGDTHHSYRLYSDGPTFFLKLNELAKQPLFIAEARGLKAIGDTQTITTCKPLCIGHCQRYSYLLLEGLNITHQGDWALAGQQLAKLHQAPAGQSFGFEHAAYCGKTFQPSPLDANWGHFFAHQRIAHQLAMFWGTPVSSPKIQTIVRIIEDQLSDRQPRPALVHGDLWSGNIGFHNDKPVVFDPACYYGDPETDLAMSELFGRLPDEFYSGYQSIAPIDSQYTTRRPIYQLYHRLNHANLFGEPYRQQAQQQLQKLTH